MAAPGGSGAAEGQFPLWLVTTGEPLPTDGPETRLLRTGIFFQELVARGHAVHWWTTAFDHAHRRHRSRRFRSVPVGGVGRLSMLPSPGYGPSVSLRRLWDHRVAARAFLKHARGAERPRAIYCAYPTIAMSRAVVSHAVRRGIPVALDIRDLWPDVIWDTVVGSSGGALRKSALATLRRSAVWAVRNATAVIGLTDEYVEWALELGGRPRSELDVAIPVTYPEYEPISDGHRTRALAFWRVQGLDLDRHAVVCFLGTLGRQFDFEPVIRAAGLLAPRYPDLRFVLCGQGEGLEVARERSRGLANVLWPGWVDGSARHLLLEHAVAGLAPYRPSENFRRNLPNKPVEYFANGIPVLYPIEGVLDRLCREHGCGVRYDPEREGHLADVVAGMLDDPQGLLAASRRASAVFQARFRAESVTDALLDHARAMSAAGRGGRRSGVA